MLESFGNVVYYIIYRKRFTAKCLQIYLAVHAAEYKKEYETCRRCGRI